MHARTLQAESTSSPRTLLQGLIKGFIIMWHWSCRELGMCANTWTYPDLEMIYCFKKRVKPHSKCVGGHSSQKCPLSENLRLLKTDLQTVKKKKEKEKKSSSNRSHNPDSWWW